MATTTWQIDPAHSSVELAVKHMMFTTVRGRFKDVKGTIVADDQNPNNSTVTVEMAAASLDTGVWRGSVQASGSSLSHRLPTLVVWLSSGLRGPGVAQGQGVAGSARTVTATLRCCATPGNGRTGCGRSKAALGSASTSPTDCSRTANRWSTSPRSCPRGPGSSPPASSPPSSPSRAARRRPLPRPLPPSRGCPRPT